MSGDPSGLGGKFLNICISVLIGMMALYGAIYILRDIWVPLCITLATIAIVSGGIALVRRHFRGW